MLQSCGKSKKNDILLASICLTKFKVPKARRRSSQNNFVQSAGKYIRSLPINIERRLHFIKVVLTTCHGAGSRQLQNMEFDILIIDEATQAMEAVCCFEIYQCNKYIVDILLAVLDTCVESQKTHPCW